MIRKIAFPALVALVAVAPRLAFADAGDDLMKVRDAFLKAKSWHAEEHFSNGRTITVDYSGPDRWRIQPNPKAMDLVLGDDVYVVNRGHAMKLPFGGGLIRKMITQVGLSMNEEVRQTARDLGTQTLDGQVVHVYSYLARKVPVTLYVGANALPVRSVVQDKKVTTTILYSNYNAPIAIDLP